MSKVVPFERDARYLLQKAAQNRRSGRPLDALSLMRRAIGLGADDAAVRLDMAQLYCEMGCNEASIRLLSALIAEDGGEAEYFFGLCCNFFALGDVESAYQALVRFLAMDPDAARREDVSELLGHLVMGKALGAFAGRKRGRARRLQGEAERALKAGDCERAERLARAALRTRADMNRSRALIALSLARAGRREEAFHQIGRVLSGGRPDAELLSAAISVYLALGRPARARRAAEAALRQKAAGRKLRLLIEACLPLGDEALTAQLLDRALRETPYDRRLLLLSAINCLRRGRPIEEAARFRARLLRIDPDDVIARCAIPTAPGEAPPDYEARLPESIRKDLLEGFRRALELGPEALPSYFEKQPRFKRVLGWALRSGEEALERPAVALLAALDGREAESLLRQYLVTPGCACPRAALEALEARGANGPVLLIEEGALKLLDGDEEALNRVFLSPSYKRVMKIAAARATGERGPELIRLWLEYLSRLDALEPLTDENGWAAALMLADALARREAEKGGGAAETETLSREIALYMGASRRLILRRARGIRRALSGRRKNHVLD